MIGSKASSAQSRNQNLIMMTKYQVWLQRIHYRTYDLTASAFSLWHRKGFNTKEASWGIAPVKLPQSNDCLDPEVFLRKTEAFSAWLNALMIFLMSSFCGSSLGKEKERALKTRNALLRILEENAIKAFKWVSAEWTRSHGAKVDCSCRYVPPIRHNSVSRRAR